MRCVFVCFGVSFLARRVPFAPCAFPNTSPPPGNTHTHTRTHTPTQEYARLSRAPDDKGGLSDAELWRPAIAVCHTFPECWGWGDSPPAEAANDRPMAAPGCPCPPVDAAAPPPLARKRFAFRVGRSMFETDGLPAHLAAHCAAMDEVWVPSEFNARTFAAAGVDPRKIRVVEEAVDAEEGGGAWDPSRFDEALDPAALSPEQIAGPPGRAAGRGSGGGGHGGGDGGKPFGERASGLGV